MTESKPLCQWPGCTKLADVLHFQAWDRDERHYCEEHSVEYQISLMGIPDADTEELRVYLRARNQRSKEREVDS